MRVAVTQFATSSNVQDNLASCIRIIDKTAACKPSLIVLPEFSNTQFSNVQLSNYKAWHEALIVNGEFLKAIAEQAKKHQCYIIINVTLRRDQSAAESDIENTHPKISITSCLFSPQGKLIHQTDKQNLSACEKNFFTDGCNFKSSQNKPAIAKTSFGSLGLLIGSDSLTYHTSRELAFNGAQLLCNSINSFALDQCSLQDPARACENNVFVATANKVGSLLPVSNEEETTEDDMASDSVAIGQSQIVAANGKILAMLANNVEGFTFADLDLAEVGLSAKCRPDGTHYTKQLRPELYSELPQGTKSAQKSVNNLPVNQEVPATANVAIFATYKDNEQAIEDVCHYIENNLSDIIQLPELFFISDKTITHDIEQRAQIERLSEQVIEQVSMVLRPFQYLCTSLVVAGKHQAVIISEQGVIATQQQLHFCQRYSWAELGNELNIIELPLEQGFINLAMLTADDVNIAEVVELAGLRNIHLLLVPFDIQEPCEVEYSLLSRAAENRICIVAATREKNFEESLSFDKSSSNIYNKNKVKAQKSTGLIANLTTSSDLLPQWKVQKFNGYINQPLVKHQYGKITKAVIHPIAACSKR